MATTPTQRTIRELRKCANCGALFAPVRADRKCCSKTCAQAMRGAGRTRQVSAIPPIQRLFASFLRFFSKIEIDDATGCWNWTAARDRHGYGRFGVRAGKTVFAHRLAYQVMEGDIPDGLGLDHLCRNTSCCNPDHLEPVTQAENVRRGARWRV